MRTVFRPGPFLSALLLAPALALAGKPTAALTPASCDVYFEWNGAADQRKALLESAWWAKLQKTAFFQAAVVNDPEFAKLKEFRFHWNRIFGMSFEKTLDALLGVQTAVAWRSDPTGRNPDGDGVILGRVADAEALKTFVAKHIAREKADGRDVRESQVEGFPVYTVGKRIVVVLGDGWAMSEREELLREVIALAAGKGEALADSAGYKQAAADLPAESVGKLYVDVKRLLASRPAPASGSPDARFRAVLASLKTFALGVSLPGGAVRVDGALRPDTGGFHPLLSAFLGAAPLEPTAVKILPADALAAGGLTLDPAALRKGLEEAIPELRDNGRMQLGFETFFKLYVERFGPEYTLAVRRIPAGSSSVVKAPAVALCIQLRDPSVVATLRSNLSLALGWANGQLAAEGIRVPSSESKHKDVAVTVIDVDALLRARKQTPLVGTLRPAIAVVGGHLVLASHESFVHAMIDAAAGAPNLGDSALYRRAVAEIGAKSSSWGCLSMPALAALLADNRALMVLGAAADQGVSAEEAGKRFDAALELMGLFDSAGFVRAHTAELSRFTIQVRTAQ